MSEKRLPGRPRTIFGPHVHREQRLPTELADRLVAYAKSVGLSQNQVMNDALYHFLENKDKETQE